jgi:hypothetical protein
MTVQEHARRELMIITVRNALYDKEDHLEEFNRMVKESVALKDIRAMSASLNEALAQ